MSDPDTRRPKFPLIAGLSLGVVVLVAVAVLVSAKLGGSDTKAPQRTQGSASPGPTRSSAGCPSDTSKAVPAAAPPAGLTWRPMTDEMPILLPASTRYGPCQTTSATGWGFAHTPAGALVAAANIFMRSSIPGPTAEHTIADQVVDGPAKERLADEVAQSAGDTAARPRFSAYAITSYTAGAVDLSLALSYPNQDDYRIYRISLQWQSGDWRMLAPIDGDWSNAVTGQATLDGYIAWGVS